MRKNEQYGMRRAPRNLSFAGRVEGNAPHPSLKVRGEGREAYSVSFFRCAKRYVFRISSVHTYYVEINLI